MIAWLFLLVCGIFSLAGGWYARLWALPNGTIVQGVIAYICFNIDCAAWFLALYYKIPMAKSSIIFGVVTTAAYVLMGTYFDDHLTTTNWVGVVFGLIAVGLLGG